MYLFEQKKINNRFIILGTVFIKKCSYLSHFKFQISACGGLKVKQDIFILINSLCII